MITRLYHATIYSLHGLRAAFKDEPAFRLECWLFTALAPLALFITPDALERALLIAVLLLVMLTEILNTAIEATINRISEERHPLSKKAKDCGSAAVFVAIALAMVVWAGVLI